MNIFRSSRIFREDAHTSVWEARVSPYPKNSRLLLMHPEQLSVGKPKGQEEQDRATMSCSSSPKISERARFMTPWLVTQ